MQNYLPHAKALGNNMQLAKMNLGSMHKVNQVVCLAFPRRQNGRLIQSATAEVASSDIPGSVTYVHV